MKKTEVKKMMNHLLKKDEDFSNDCYTEWQFNCNQNKATKVDEKGNILKIRKFTYNEICKETIEDAMQNLPEDITKWSEEEVKDFLFEWLYRIFCQHNSN